MSLKTLEHIQNSLSTITGFQNPLSVAEFIVSSEQNSFLIKESADGADVMICLKPDLIEKISQMKLPKDFQLDLMPDLSIAIEELSHFNTYCSRALKEHEVSAIELEVQAEVDKFGLMLDWAYTKNEEHLREKIFSILFDDFKLGGWVPQSEYSRYEDAHLIARNFCRGLLDKDMNRAEFNKCMQDFFSLQGSEKLTPKVK